MTPPQLRATIDHMSEDNPRVQKVRRYYDRIDANSPDEALSDFAESAVYSRPGYDSFEGLGAIRDFYAEARVIESGRHVLDQILSEDLAVSVAGRFSGRLLTGEDVEVGFAEFWSFDERDRVSRRTTYFFAPAV